MTTEKTDCQEPTEAESQDKIPDFGPLGKSLKPGAFVAVNRSVENADGENAPGACPRFAKMLELEQTNP